MRQKNVLIQKLHLEIQSLDETQSLPKANDRGKLNDLLKSHLMTEENWINFRLEFEREHANFYKILIKDFPEITDSNLRIILLQKLNFTNAETAGLLGITVEAVKKSKQRLKKKLAEKHNLLFEMITS